MTYCLTLSSTDVAAGRIAARHRARIAHLRTGSWAVAGAQMRNARAVAGGDAPGRHVG